MFCWKKKGEAAIRKKAEGRLAKHKKKSKKAHSRHASAAKARGGGSHHAKGSNHAEMSHLYHNTKDKSRVVEHDERKGNGIRSHAKGSLPRSPYLSRIHHSLRSSHSHGARRPSHKKRRRKRRKRRRNHHHHHHHGSACAKSPPSRGV